MIKRIRTKEYRIIYSAFLFLSITLFSVSQASGAAGTSRAEFLLIGVGARPAGMGEAYTAVADDVNTIAYNPAGLGCIDDTQITLMHSDWIDDIGYEYLGAAHSFGGAGTLGLEVRYLHMGKLTGRALNGKATGEFNACNTSAALSYGRRLMNDICFGVNLKVLHEKIEKESSYGFAFDVGGLYGMDLENNRLQFGLAVQNIGPEMKFIKDKEPLPVNIKTGASYKMLDNALLLALDVNIPVHGSPYVNMGSEYSIANIISARIGYKTEKELVSSSKLNLGLGFYWKDCGLDYTFVPFNNLGQTHRFSLIVKFGKKGSSKETGILKIENKLNCNIPDTPAIEIVDISKVNLMEILEEGGGVIVLDNGIVKFNNNKFGIKITDFNILDRIADILQVMTEYKIEIVNHDENIKSYFLKKGINTERIIYKNSGDHPAYLEKAEKNNWK